MVDLSTLKIRLVRVLVLATVEVQLVVECQNWRLQLQQCQNWRLQLKQCQILEAPIIAVSELEAPVGAAGVI